MIGQSFKVLTKMLGRRVRFVHIV